MSFRFVTEGAAGPGPPSPVTVSPGLDDVLPVHTLSNSTSYPANNFPGFITPATTVTNGRSGTSPDLGIYPTGDTDVLAFQTKRPWRDASVSSWVGGGAFYLRISGSPGLQTALYFWYNRSVTGGYIEVGIITGADFTISGAGYNFGGAVYAYYKVSNFAASPEGIAAGFVNSYVSGKSFTFGCNGFQVFLQYNGIDILRYTEWRCAKAGTTGIWVHDNEVATDITTHYSALLPLFSYPEGNVFDPRDFGMRAVAPVTGSMSAASNQLVLNAPSTFQVGDQIIVEAGGEAGGYTQGVIGVGGTWPALNYANLTAMNADTSQAMGTYAYLQSPSALPVYCWNGSVWLNTLGAPTANVFHYCVNAVPISLVAKVIGVSPDTKTLTLSANAAAATTNANIYLDCLPSYFIVNQAITSAQFAAGTVFAPMPPNLQLITPPGTWAISGPVRGMGAGPVNIANGFKFMGSMLGATIFKIPNGITCGIFWPSVTGISNIFVGIFSIIGNVQVVGGVPMGGINTLQPSIAGTFPPCVILQGAGGDTGYVISNITATNTFVLATIGGTTNPLIEKLNITLTIPIYDYVGWYCQLSNTSGGVIRDCSMNAAALQNTFEFFACNGATILRCGGQNALYSTNSSTSWTIDFGPGQTTVDTITANCMVPGTNSAAFFDTAIIDVNDNAFGGGNTGTIKNPNITIQGYGNANNDTNKFIHIQPLQTGVTIQGEYPGSGGCSTTLGGILIAPDYNGTSGAYGPIVKSDASNTTITGIRIKGVGRPSSSPINGSYGNISITAAVSATGVVTNCVADVVQPTAGLTTSGDQTNTAYGGC